MYFKNIFLSALALTTAINSYTMDLNTHEQDYSAYQIYQSQENNKQHQHVFIRYKGKSINIPHNSNDTVGYFREYTRLKLKFELSTVVKPEEMVCFSFEGCKDHPDTALCIDAKIITGSVPLVYISNRKSREEHAKQYNPEMLPTIRKQ